MRYESTSRMSVRAALACVVAAAAITVAAGGCGGGSSSPTPTATAPATPPESPAALELRQYLIRSNEARKQYRSALRTADRAFNVLPESTPRAPRDVLDRADALYRQAAAMMEASAVKQLQAKPPASLRAINRRFASLSTRYGAHYRDLAVVLKNMGENDTFRDFNTAWERQVTDVNARPEWRVAVTAYAGEIGATLPGWVSTIGKPVGGGD